jgi:hypothetical protein
MQGLVISEGMSRLLVKCAVYLRYALRLNSQLILARRNRPLCNFFVELQGSLDCFTAPFTSEFVKLLAIAFDAELRRLAVPALRS